MTMAAATPTILVIDDEVQIRRLLRITLEAAGYAVVEADTGQLGLSEVPRSQPDAVVLDLGLPDMGGLEVLGKLREWSQGSRAGAHRARGRGATRWRRSTQGRTTTSPSPLAPRS